MNGLPLTNVSPMDPDSDVANLTKSKIDNLPPPINPCEVTPKPQITFDGKLLKEVNTLKAWKEEALIVFNDLDLQEIGKILDIPLGANIAKEVVPRIKKIISQSMSLVAALHDIAWMRDGDINIAASTAENVIKKLRKTINE